MIKGSDWGGSRLVAAQKCKQYYYNRYERPNSEGTRGIVRLEDGYAASKGTLLHVFWQDYYERLIKDPEGDKREHGLNAIKKMLDSVSKFNLPTGKVELICDEIIAAADQYLIHYAHDQLKPIAVEAPVEVRLARPDGLVDVHTGIIDLVAEWMGGLFIVDHKTTTRTFASLFQSYTNNLSFKGYCKAASQNYGKPVGVMINGLRFKNNKALEVEFEREPYMYSQKDFDDFDRTVASIKREIEACHLDDFWPKSGDQCVQVWGTCDYFALCKFDDPAMQNALYKPAKPKEVPNERAVGERDTSV